MSVASLEQSLQWFQDLRILLTGADQPFVGPVGEREIPVAQTLLEELQAKQDELDVHVTILRDAATQLDWEDAEAEQAYLDALEASADTLAAGLADLSTTEPLDTEQKDELYAAADDLYERAAGLLEDC